MPFNLVDIILMVAFVVIVIASFVAGVVRVVMALVSLYLAVIAGGFFYVPLSRSLADRLAAMSPFTAEVVAFFSLTVLTTVLLTISLAMTFGTLRLPRWLSGLDQVGGAALGIGAATFATVVTMVALSVFFTVVTTASRGGVPVWPPLIVLADQARASSLSRFFVLLSLPLFRIITPWFPEGLPPILNAFAQ